MLKELIAKEMDEEINVLELNKQELEDKLEEFGLTIDDYIEPISKEEILDAMPMI